MRTGYQSWSQTVQAVAPVSVDPRQKIYRTKREQLQQAQAMARRIPGGWRIANELKGRTLRELIDLGISVSFDCGQCNRVAVWPWPWMMHERKLQPLMSKKIHEFANKLRCVSCEAQDFYVRRSTPGDQRPLPGS
jgi:hypothetical protein